jgi:hypothetical protein
MTDTLQPYIDSKKFTQTDVVFTGSAKPPIEAPRRPATSDTLQSMDAILDGVLSFNTINASKVNEMANQIENMQNHLDNTQKVNVRKNIAALKKEMDALEVIEVADALATIDSPWGTLTRDISDSNRLKQTLPDANAREQYVDKLLFPLGAELYRDIRLMTDDPLTRQLMFQSIADDIRRSPDRILLAQNALPKPTDTGSVKLSIRRVSLGLLGGKLSGNESEAQIEHLYRSRIHTAVLRSRLSAESPVFSITDTEKTITNATHEAHKPSMPFAKEAATHMLRDSQTELTDMKRIRQIIDRELPSVRDEQSLMHALDAIQRARFEDAEQEIAPYKLEPWVPKNIQRQARTALERLSKPKEDLYAKILKKVDSTERTLKSQTSWGETKYKDHMKWLADPVAQANRTKRIIDIIDLTMTLTTLVYGATGGIQRQVEGTNPNGVTIKDYIAYMESQQPWEAAADIATPKQPKI